jgi:putative oxidoreductase
MTEPILPVYSRYQAWTHTLLRVVAGGVFMQHGVQKAAALLSHQPLGTLPSIALVLETLGATLIILGLFTRIVAFLCSGEMAVAFFLFHWPRGFWPVQNHGETPVLLCFIFLYLSAVGGGPFSLDAVFNRRHVAG